MNFQKVSISILLDFDSIKEVRDIEKSRQFMQWNTLIQKKRNLIFNEAHLYHDPNFRMIRNVNFLYDESSSYPNENERLYDRQNEAQSERETKNYKKKKISKVDKYHIKQQKHSKKEQKHSQVSSPLSKRQYLRRKQLEAQQKTYRTLRRPKQQSSKKLPKQLQNSRQQKVSKYKKPKTPGIRNNFHMSELSEPKKSRKNIETDSQSEAYQSIEEQQSSFSGQIGYSNSKAKNRGRPKKMFSSGKHHRSHSNKKDIKVPQKLNYFLQREQNMVQLKEKFTKQVLNEVPGRKEQANQIFKQIIHAQNGAATPICLNGNTGCGKTSLITKMLNFIMRECKDNFSTAYLNCMSMWNVNHVYSGILYKLFGLKEKKSEIALNSLFQCSKKIAHTTKTVDSSKDLLSQIEKTKIIVLDEIDFFIKDQSFFYNLLEWTHIKNSKIVLIMISNVLDLSAKLSAKIQSRMKFVNVVFKPYTAEAVEQIMKYKYPQCAKIFEPKAIQFLCKKIVSINSDIRLLEKTYEDVITQWMEANGLVETERQEKQNYQHSGNMELQEDNDSEQSKSVNQGYQRKSLPQNNRQRKQLIEKLIILSKTRRIKIEDVHRSLFLTGEMCNDQLPEIMKEYKILLQALHQARKKQDISFQIMNKTYLAQKRMPSSQQVFLQMCELKDMGLVEFRQNTRNCDVIFQGFGIKVNPELHMLCPEE